MSVDTNNLHDFTQKVDKYKTIHNVFININRSGGQVTYSMSDTNPYESSAEWAYNFFTGKRGDAMVVSEDNGQLLGFLQLLYQGEQLIIDLIAVDKNGRRRGIASDMIAFAENQCGDFKTISVGTQIVNEPSINMYIRYGFSFCASQYIFHYHNN